MTRNEFEYVHPKIILLLLLILLTPSCFFKNFESIKLINSFNEIDFNIIASDSLVILDVDETLIQPKDTLIINEHSQEAKNFKVKLIQQYPDIKNWDNLYSIMILQAERPLLEPDIIEKINQLKNRNIPVIALTAMNTGKIGYIEHTEQWRYEQLKSLGFEGSYSNLNTSLPSSQGHPVFYKGILATDLAAKGPILGSFLDYIALKPKQIIMIDDSLDMLKSVEAESKSRGIQFQGYHYKYAKQKSWNEALAQFQINHLVKHNEWLNDEQAQEKMYKKNLAYDYY